MKATKVNITSILLIVIIIGLLAYYFKDKVKEFVKPSSTPNEDTPDTLESVTVPIEMPSVKPVPSTAGAKKLPAYNTLDFNTILNVGSKGREVVVMQRVINTLFESKGESFKKIEEDGIFGKNETLPAVKDLFPSWKPFNLAAIKTYVNIVYKK